MICYTSWCQVEQQNAGEMWRCSVCRMQWKNDAESSACMPREKRKTQNIYFKNTTNKQRTRPTVSRSRDAIHWPAKGESQKGNSQKVTFESLESA